MSGYLQGLQPKPPPCLSGPALRGTAQDFVASVQWALEFRRKFRQEVRRSRVNQGCSMLLLLSLICSRILLYIWVRYPPSGTSGKISIFVGFGDVLGSSLDAVGVIFLYIFDTRVPSFRKLRLKALAQMFQDRYGTPNLTKSHVFGRAPMCSKHNTYCTDFILSCFWPDSLTRPAPDVNLRGCG